MTLAYNDDGSRLILHHHFTNNATFNAQIDLIPKPPSSFNEGLDDFIEAFAS